MEADAGDFKIIAESKELNSPNVFLQGEMK
jgi:hypothetical protein